MSPNEIDALRQDVNQLRAQLRKKRRRAPIIAKWNELRAEIDAPQKPLDLQVLSGFSEGLV